MPFDDCKRRGCVLIHTQAQNAGNAKKRLINSPQWKATYKLLNLTS